MITVTPADSEGHLTVAAIALMTGRLTRKSTSTSRTERQPAPAQAA
ncbi:MAG TPA: hypothetical protein VFV66_10255 [Nonomuraea sp.]|nr:hypothetical protein [Nonomuraea sp.]